MLDLSNFLSSKKPQKTAGSYWQDQALEIATVLGEASNERRKAQYMKLCKRSPSMVGTYLAWAKEIVANPKSLNPAAVFWFKVRAK